MPDCGAVHLDPMVPASSLTHRLVPASGHGRVLLCLGKDALVFRVNAMTRANDLDAKTVSTTRKCC
jgi:hypothetical protein